MPSRALLSTCLALCAAHVAAAPLVNGDFSAGLSGWNDASATGAVTVAGGQARLATGTGVGPYSAVLVQGDDGGFSFAAPVTLGPAAARLEFDAGFSSTAALDEGIGGFVDSLGVVIYDAGDSSRDLVFANLGGVLNVCSIVSAT